MDRPIKELFLSCRKGDLSRVRHLVEQKEVELNVRDNWDSTPLYYACLCGHVDVVQYLLENGARCEANTFDGERCLYGALSTEIRNLLRNFKVVTSKSLRRDLYDEFLRRCLENGDYHDILFVVHGEGIAAHRCILSVRCEYFSEMFLNKWRFRRVINITHPKVTPYTFLAVLQYLYTGSLETHVECVDDCIVVARQCRLFRLIEKLEEAYRKVKSFECTKPGTNVTTLIIEAGPDREQQQDFGILAFQALPQELCNWVGGSELPFLPNFGNAPFADLCINVRGHHFLCHKVFFCGRSDYFKGHLANHFLETEIDLSMDIPILTLNDMSVEIFVSILYYIYQNTVELSPSSVCDVLCAADMYLLPGLKRDCATYIGSHLDAGNVVNILRTARIFELPRLEDRCAEYMAKNLDEAMEDTDFHKLIQEDANNIWHREETDSISIIDDIRYHITSNVQTFSAMEEANEKLAAIDQLLEQLELDA